MKLSIKFVKSSIEKISREMDQIEVKQKDAEKRQRDFLESCKDNSSIQQRINQSRKSIQRK